MTRKTYPLSPVSPYDFIATGELGPVQMVSGGRMLRTLTRGGRYCGGIYASINRDKPLSDEIERIPGRDSVAFELAPYETCHGNRDFTSRGEYGTVNVPRYDPETAGEHPDYALWNTAAGALSDASLALTSDYGRTGPPHFERGRWQCRYVGSDGVNTVWHHCRAISAGLLPVSMGSRPHFLAVDARGAQYRLCVHWRRDPDCGASLDVAAIHQGGPTAAIPQYLKRWALSRCR